MTTTTARTMTRLASAVLVAALLAAAVVLAQSELITAAMLAGVAGLGRDVRQARAIARRR